MRAIFLGEARMIERRIIMRLSVFDVLLAGACPIRFRLKGALGWLSVSDILVLWPG